MPQIPFIGRRRNPRTIYADANFWARKVDRAGQSTLELLPTPGATAWVDLSTAAVVRGLYTWSEQNLLIAVVGNKLKKITTAGTVTELGTLDTATGPVSIISNGSQIMLVDGTSGYLSTTTVFSKINDADFPASPTGVSYQDGYGIVAKAGTQSFYISALYDFTYWAALDFASAEGFPDNLKNTFDDHQELWLCGTDTLEPWVNTGNADFPFEPYGSGYVEDGIASPAAICKFDNSVCYLSKDGRIKRLQGYSPVPISDREIDYAIGTYTKSDAILWQEIWEGHEWLVATFPTSAATWVFDAATGLWHRRKSPGLTRHLGNCYAFFNGTHVVGHVSNGKLYTLSLSTPSDISVGMDRIWTLPPVESGDDSPVHHNKLRIIVDKATASAASLEVTYSDDGEASWKTARTVALGTAAVKDKRLTLNRLGMSRSRTYKITLPDDYLVDLRITGVHLNPPKSEG